MDQRYAKMRAHTATHLLHAELAKIFPNTKQAGSLVDEDLLRFDFYANNLLTSEQIRVFKGFDLTISSATKTIKSIEFTCTANGTTKYGPGCFAAQTGYSYSGKIGTWTGSASSITFTAESNQVRITQIIITFE